MRETVATPARTHEQVADPAEGAPSSVAHASPTAVGHRGTHAHLWSLPDGTGLHAPYGQLVRDPGTGRVCCHLCGRWFRSVSSHVRRHGYTAESYREAIGLCRTRPLTSDDVSAAISRRQADAYLRQPEVRERLEVGQRLARSGQLGWRARGAVDREPPAELVAVRRDTLGRGRQTRIRERDDILSVRLDELGCSDLGDYLRTAYAAGASLADLRTATGLGVARLRAAMATAGVDVRRPGDTTPAGRRARALANEKTAAARVGTDDISAWLTERHAAGWSLSRLGREVGRSAHWVRWRLGPSQE